MKKIFAAFIIIFIAMPILFALIWVSGLQRAIISDEFLHDFPQEIREQLPKLIDNSQNIALIHSNQETKIWLQALDKSGSSLREFLKETGITKWFGDEALGIFQQLEEWMKEERPQENRDIIIKLDPLKAALTSDKFEQKLTDIMNNLPACNNEEQKEWEFIVNNYKGNEDINNLPNCKPPDVKNAVKIITENIKQKLKYMPPQLHLFSTTGLNINGVRIKDGLNKKKMIDKFIILSFLVPCFFLALGALIGSKGKASFLRWFAMPLITCGIVAIACSSAIKNIFLMSIDFPYMFGNGQEFPLSEELAAQLYNITEMGLNIFLKSVNNISSIIAIIGLVIFAISYTFNNERR